LPRYYTKDPHGDNSFGSRCAGAFAGAVFGLPLVGLWWLWLNYEAVGTDVHFPFRLAAYALAGLALFGFLFPRVLPALYGGAWKLLSELSHRSR
jgi:hypothetical protein